MDGSLKPDISLRLLFRQMTRKASDEKNINLILEFLVTRLPVVIAVHANYHFIVLKNDIQFDDPLPHYNSVENWTANCFISCVFSAFIALRKI